MEFSEVKRVTRKLYVAPCLKCGHTEILIRDSGYSSFNLGGGACKQCGHEVHASVGCLPTIDELVAIWNKGNDLQVLIDAQQAAIDDATAQIQEFQRLAESRRQPVFVGPVTHYQPAPKQDGDGKNDPLYADAVALVRKTGRPSISLVQRHLRIRYNRAARLVEDMVGTVLSEYSTRAKVLPEGTNA